MLEILQFIFSSFWVWLGTAVLLGIMTAGMASAMAIVFGRIKNSSDAE